MKRVLVILLVIMTLPALATTAQADLLHSFQIQSRSANGMRISFELPEYTISQIEERGQTYQKIQLEGANSNAPTGMPELPFFSTTIAIPATGNVELNLTTRAQDVAANYHPYPAQDMQAESGESFSKNAAFYNSTEIYPAKVAALSEPMILRDLRIITLQVNPFVYDAGRQELVIRQKVDIDLRFTSAESINELPAEPQSLSPSFAKIYESLILNFDDYRDLVMANTPPRYLIIYGNNTDNTFHDALDQYVLWKRQKGADVDLASTASSEAGSSSTSIQAYIRNRYNNPATRPDYVILLGDTSGSFTIPAFTYSSGGTDYPYTHMNTGDMLGDVFIGRISAENINQLLVLFAKIYLYERDLNLDTADWLDRLLLIGDTSPSGISTMYINKYIKEMALEVNPNYTATEMYNDSFSSLVSTINGAINQGVGFYSYRGYIDYSPPSESTLFNGYKLVHAVNITCATNNYSGSTSEMESFIRYGTTAAPKGAVTGIGMSTSSTHTTFNNVLHGGIFHGIFAYGMRTMGEALLHGKLYMNDIFGVSSPSSVGSFTHWCNLMGDPTMEVYTGIPNSFQIDTEANIPLGLSLLDVAVADSAGLAVEGASVVLSLGSEILSRGYTDAEGNVILILPETMPAGAAQLTISAHNFKPLLHSIDIVDIASLVPGDIVIDDSQSGNNNGIISAGETVELYFGLLNTGESNLNRISGVLYSDSPWINIIQGTALYPPIQPGISTPNNNPVVIEVAADTPHETMLRLHLLLGDGATQSFDVSEFIPVESARIQYHDQELAIMGDESNILDPGETAQFNVSIINTGAIGLSNVYAELISENDLLEVVQSTADYGTLDLGVVVEANAAFQIFCREQALPGMLIPMSLRIYNSAGFEQMVPLTLTIGSATQQDPLGPDSYGYVIYDWTDSSYLEAPTYEWFEINPELGGLGTSLPISDAYNGSDEGDQVGAESLAQVSLPFVFQFYGRHYDQITVCSNGFIALGETGNAEFRNFRLPGAMGPSPMIAAFWDDLATTSSSGIYSYFDRQNRRFIIEWYHLVNGKNGSSLETFQIMLYDQNYYYTSLGDGPIKIQYQTFNNVNSQSGNEHGNYCTIGIEDHTGTRGLEYTFNNTYPTAAAELSNGTAIYITNNPSMYEAPVLQEFLAEIELHQGEKYLITNLEDYFYSEAYLSYTMQTSPFVQATQTDAGILLSFDPEFYGRIDLHIRATDPMGRYVEQEVKAIVHEASGLFEDFDTSTDLPDGWSVSHLGSTTETWQVVSNPTGGFHVQTSTSAYHSANERLNSPSFNLSGFTNTKLRFFMDYQPLANNQSKLEYSFNGFIWTPVDTFNSPFTGYKSYYLNILDNSVVRFRWTYVSSTNSSATANHWIVDDLSITSLIPDLTSPPAVSNFALSDQSMGIVTLSWNPSYDDFFSHYEIYISQNPEVNTNDLLFSVSDDPALGYMNTSTTSISGLPHGSYWLAIRAVDLSGNSSPLSESIDFVLGAVPASVQSLHISYGESQITLTWDEVSTDISGNPMLISGYKVYGAQIPNFECSDDTLLDSTAELQYVADPDNQARFFKVTAYSE